MKPVDSAPKRGGGVKFDVLVDRQVGDPRFERERQYRLEAKENGAKPVSSTFDAFARMAAGVEGRTLAQKLSDPNRPTWETYKKDNESKLDTSNGDLKKMAEYRAMLDKEREMRLQDRLSAQKRQYESSDSSDSDSSDHSSRKKKKKKDEKKKKEKHKKKDKKRRKDDRHHDSDSSSDH